MAKQEIKQEQVLNVEEAVSRSEAFINKNKKTIVGIVCAIVILIAGSVLLTTQYIRPREQKAAEALFAGERYFQNGDYETALNGDQNEYAGFEAVINEFGGTKAGKLAKAYAGISLAKLGRHEEAIPYLKSFKGDDVMVAPSVLAALGNCYAQMGNEAQAAATLIKAAQKVDNNLLSPAYLIQAGQIYEKLGKNSDALKAYQEVKDKYYGSTQAMDIDRYIERVK
jgi:tetratricopeptide (TPR) repeat protein